MRVECTPSDMLVSLSLANDFRGRIYATGNPQACFELGTGRSEMTLKIPLGTECGTVQQVRNKRSRLILYDANCVSFSMFRIEVVMSTMWLFRTIQSLCRIRTKLFALNAHSRPKIKPSVLDLQVALVMEEKIMREASV